MKKYGVIMAGGNSARFWPLSRRKQPKQLLNLSGRDLMINETIDRLAFTTQEIYISTNAGQMESMLRATAGRVRPDHVFAEPASRNTAACIGYAAAQMMHRHGDGVMVISPSDAYIRDTAAYTRTLADAVNAAQAMDKLVTVGISPNYPATGYGYIRCGDPCGDAARAVLEFREKPDGETARRYLESGEYLWNSGIFIWKASVILEQFRRRIPDIHAQLARIMRAMGTPDEQRVLNEVYPAIRNISIDYAVMEPAAAAGDVLVVPGDFGWSDVGSWDMMNVFHEADEDGNIALGDVLLMDSRDTTVYAADKTVAVVGADNLVVVQTPDAILVCDKRRAQEVKRVVERLEAQGRTVLL